MPAGAQELHRRGDDHDRGRTQQRYDGRDARRDYRDYDHDRYRGAGYVTYGPAYPATGYYVHDDGIGPGKGAAIGAVGGAILGALVGGGKGAIIGGAAGAGVGAVAGQAAQDNRRYGY
jgi:hypothetical protein